MGAAGAQGPAGEGLDGVVANDVVFEGAVTIDDTLDGAAIDDLLWTINHSAAVGVCASLDRNFNGFSQGKFVLPNTGASCNAVCQAFGNASPAGNDAGSCVAQVSLRPVRGRVTATNTAVGRHETSGCATGPAGRGSAESELAEADPEGATFFNYCCCSLDVIP